jgi:hypothetical protein
VQVQAQPLCLRGNDTTNAPEGIGKPLAATHIVEKVMSNADGKSFSGTFTLDAYDTSLTARRISSA